MSGYLWEDLESSGLLPAGIKANGDADFYVDMDSPEWRDDLKETLRHLVKNPRSLEYIQIYQRCSASTKRGEQAVFYPLGDFEIKNGKFTSSLRTKLNLINVEKALVFKANNLPILRMYMMGDESLPIICPWTKHQIDSLEFEGEPVFNIWEQHHYKVVNRSSIQKEGSDPGEILRSTDFRAPSPRSRMAIEDMMRTNFLSPTAHKIVHNRWNNSDITNYNVDQLPWALKNETNYDSFIRYLRSFGYDAFPAYLEWIESLKLTDADFG
jgi:hypothetical protein